VIRRHVHGASTDQLHEIAVTAIMLIGLAIVRFILRLDHELTMRTRMVSTEDFHEFGVHRDVVFRREGFRAEVFGRLDVNNSLRALFSVSL
jgi:hypothetical protein